MPKDLTDIYDEGFGPGDDPKPTPKVNNKGYDPFKSYTNAQPKRQSISTLGAYADVDISKYAPQYDAHSLGITNPNTNAVKNDIMLGNMQSAWDKLGNWAVRTTTKIGTGLVESVGYAGALLTEWGDDRDYSNGLTELAKGWNQSLDEALPIYRTTDKTWGLNDFGWWLQNSEGLVSTVASFAIGGMGIAKGVGLLGKLTKGAQALEYLTGGVKAGQTVSKLLTAGGLAYAEGAMSGNRVFGEVYNSQYQKSLAAGLSPDEADAKAKYIASQSASTTVQLNTILNTGMNMYSVIPFFNHEEQVIENIAKKNFFQNAGESVTDWGKRVGGYTIDNFKKEAFKGEGKVAALREAIGEGTEELTNQFAERTGIEEGKEGKIYSILGQLGQLSKYFNRTMDSEGALNFVMGAIAGPATNVVTTNIPIHKVQTGYKLDEKGTPQMDEKGEPIPNFKLMTSRNKNKFGNTNYFNNIRDAVKEDIDVFQDKQTKIQKAKQAGNFEQAEALKSELFHLQSKRSVQLGFADNLAESYRQIAGLDNTKSEREDLVPKIQELTAQIEEGKKTGADTTELEAQLAPLQEQYNKTPEQTEAMRMGFAKDMNDTAYQIKAKEAVETLGELQKIHEKVMTKYGMDSRTIGDKDTEVDPLVTHISDFIFDRTANLHLMRKQAAKWQNKINELQENQAGITDVIYGQDLQNQLNQQKEYQRLRTRYFGTAAVIEQEDKILADAQNNPTPTNIANAQDVLEKYGAIGVNADDTVKAIGDTRKKLRTISDSINTKLTQANENIINSSGYSEWVKKNPNKTFEDYNNDVNKKHELSIEEKFLHTNLEDLNNRIDANAQNLDELQNSRTMNRILKSTQSWWDKLAAERKQQIEAQTTIKEQRQANELLSKKLNLARMKNLKNQYAKEMKEVQERIEQINTRLGELRTSLQSLENSEKIVLLDTYAKQELYNNISQEKAELTREFEKLTNRLNVLQSAYGELDADIQATENNEIITDGTIDDEPVDDQEQPLEETGTSEEEQQPVVENPISEQVEEIPPVESPIIEPLQAYEGLVMQLPAVVQRALKEYETQLRLGEREFTYDALSSFIDVGEITQGQSASVLQALKEYMDSAKQEIEDIALTEQSTEEVSDQPIPEQVETDGLEVEEGIVIHDSLVTDNTELTIDRLPTTEDRTFAGAKTIEAASTLAGMDLEYDEDFDEEGNKYFKEALNNINQNTHVSVFDPKGLAPGTKLLIVVDDIYDGAKNNTNKLTMDDYGHRVLGAEKFEDYLDESGKIKIDDKSIGNVPIKVVNEKGETVRYIRTNDWITTKYDATSGPEGFRNVYDGSMEEGDVPTGNVARQAAINLEFRRRLVEKFNRGEVEGMVTQVQDKGAGMIILNRERSEVFGKRGKNVWDKAAQLLPDTQLQIAIKQGNKLLVDTGGVVTTKDVVTELPDYLQNRTVFLLPGTNGQHHAAVAKGVNLADNGIALSTISRVIELHLENDTQSKDANKIQDKTGFDVRTVKGLKAFINQYFTHTSNWSAAKTVNTNGKELNVLDIQPATNTEFKNRIIIGNVSPVGLKEVTADLVGGKLTPEFKQALNRLLSERLKNVVFSKPELGIRGINEQVTSTFIEPRANAKGELSFREHKNYNEYIKNHLLVNVNGTNTVKVKDNRGREKDMYVYAVNPKLQIDTNAILGTPQVTPATDTTLPHPVVTPSVEETSDADILANLFDARPEVTIEGASSLDGMDVNTKNLLELFNLAANNRNGKTVDEVYSYLTQNGISTLYKGFNPFIKCT